MKARICLAALCFLVFHCSPVCGQPPKNNERSAEWEYKQLYNPSDEFLNHHAKDGWEVAAAAAGGSDNPNYWVILKRSKSHPLFGAPTSNVLIPASPPTFQKSKCKLTLAQAPVIRGFRLGMTSDEVFAIFPADEREQSDRAQQLKSAELPPNYGYTYFRFNPSGYATKDRFMGVSSLTIGLFDGKVVYISASYSNTPRFDRVGQSMEIITRQFGLPEFKAWPGYNEYSEYWNNPSLSCDGFAFQVYVSESSISINLSDPAYKKIADERKKADLSKKLEEFKF